MFNVQSENYFQKFTFFVIFQEKSPNYENTRVFWQNYEKHHFFQIYFQIEQIKFNIFNLVESTLHTIYIFKTIWQPKESKNRW